MTETILRESVTEAPVKSGNRWRVIVAKPGQGSSGHYSEDVFRRDAAKIIQPGAQSFINHDDSRNPKDMIGVFPEAAYWDETEKAVVAELQVFSHWEAFVNEVGPHCGISLYAMGEQDDEGNVTAFIEDRLNGADLVARPGLVGSGLAEKLYESAKALAVTKTSDTVSLDENRKEIMEEKLDKLIELMTSLVAEKAVKADEAAQVEADTRAVEAAVAAFEAAVVQIDSADLLPSQVESLRQAAKSGQDVAPLIEAAKKVKEDALAAVRTAEGAVAGRDFGGDKVTRFGAWS